MVLYPNLKRLTLPWPRHPWPLLFCFFFCLFFFRSVMVALIKELEQRLRRDQLPWKSLRYTQNKNFSVQDLNFLQ